MVEVRLFTHYDSGDQPVAQVAGSRERISDGVGGGHSGSQRKEI
jgi:hypothetical protein